MRTNTLSAPARINSALAILRVIVGATFLMHGAQKVFVYGLAGVTGSFAQMGIPLPGITGPLVAFLELFGGLALMLGLFTRLTSLGLAINMLGAMTMVHLANGFFLPNGYEFTLVLLGASATLALTGAGAYSLDAMIPRRHATKEEVPAAARHVA
jgi:putative oxidoreductase